MQNSAAVLNNYDNVLNRVKQAALRSGRDFSGVKILTVTKYARAEDILTLLNNRPVFAVGESRLQEAVKKWGGVDLNLCKPQKTKKFFIGALQSNKTLKILQNFDLICSLSSLTIAKRLDTQAREIGQNAACLLQLNLTGKANQGGVSLKEAGALLKEIQKTCPAVVLKGLMALAPIVDDPQTLRPMFREVKRFFDDNFDSGAYLSLGMSGDFEVAVEEGSNLPRIGSAIFDFDGSSNGGSNDN